MKMWETAFDFTGLATSKYTFNGMLDLTAWPPAFTQRMKTDERAGCDRRGKSSNHRSRGNER
jgi:hypothetical protein